MSGNIYPGPPENPVVSKLKAPAIAVIVAGVINILFALLLLLGGVARLTGGESAQTFASNAERTGYYLGQTVTYFSALLSLLASPGVIYGGFQMFGGKGYEVARAAAIIVMIPFTSCCCLAGIPAGLWALITLNQPDVKAYFGRY
jgi:uncharacterized membrane protein YphA (DoxX/SURF4 family)